MQSDSKILRNNGINEGIIFHCHSASQMILLQKAFNGGNFKISVVGDYDFDKYRFVAKTGIVLDTSCARWKNVVDRHSKFESGHRVTMIIKTLDLNSTIRVISQNNLKINSDLILIDLNENKNYLYEAYNTGYYSEGAFVVRNVGFWNSTLHIHKPSRFDLQGAKLRCVSVITEKLINETSRRFLEESRHDKPDTLHKLKFFTVIGYLQQMYNFSVIVQRTNSWGYSRNGSFDGLVGSLQRGEAEFGCSPVLFKINRAEVINYVVPTWQTKHSFLFRQPKFQTEYFSVYSRPLDGVVWCCSLAVLLSAGLSLYFIRKIQATNSFDSEKDSSLSYLWLLICSAVCQQGMPVNRKSNSAKMIIFVIFMFATMVYQFYNANVLSSLLNDQFSNIRNLNELLDSDLHAGVEDMLFNRDYFRSTTDPVTLSFYKKKLATGKTYNFFDAEYGMALVKRGRFAFHVDTSSAYRVMRRTFTDQEICEVKEVQLFPPQYVGAVAVKGSPYREYIAEGVTRMLESGLMNRIKSVWDSRKPPCAKQRYSSIVAVNIREFSMPLLFLICGCIISFIILLYEIYISRKNRRVAYEHRNIVLPKLLYRALKTYDEMRAEVDNANVRSMHKMVTNLDAIVLPKQLYRGLGEVRRTGKWEYHPSRSVSQMSTLTFLFFGLKFAALYGTVQRSR
ncbi:ionotropic receptor 75a-like [Battus philenor]|uniref:ionotropic receptor 75a-like n=1 Tax=Battus philenor TaxID=42288 RepID=UPI0035CF8F7E